MKSTLFKDLNITKKSPRLIVTESMGDIVTDGKGNPINTPNSNLLVALDNIHRLTQHDRNDLLDRLSELTPSEIYKNFEKVTSAVGNKHSILTVIMPHLTVTELLALKNNEFILDTGENKESCCQFIDNHIEWRQSSSSYTKLKIFEERTKSIISNPFNVMVIRELYHNWLMQIVKGSNELDIDMIISMINNEDAEIVQSTFYTISYLLYELTRHMTIMEQDLSGIDDVVKTLIDKCNSGNNRTLLRKIVTYASGVISYKFASIISESRQDANTEIVQKCIKLFGEAVISDYTNCITESVAQQSAAHAEEESEETEQEIENLEVDFEDESISLLMDDNDTEVEMEQISNMLKIAVVYESKLADVAVKGAQGAQKGVRYAANKTKDVATDVKRVAKATTEIPKPFTDLVKNSLTKMKDMDKDARRDAVIKGGFKYKLFKLIKLGIKIIAATGAVGVLGPVLGSISILVGFALDSRLDAKYKKEILHELEQELKIVDEKIDDARGDSDKKAKYELMRIKDKLEKDIRRIKLGLDSL